MLGPWVCSMVLAPSLLHFPQNQLLKLYIKKLGLRFSIVGGGGKKDEAF